MAVINPGKHALITFNNSTNIALRALPNAGAFEPITVMKLTNPRANAAATTGIVAANDNIPATNIPIQSYQRH